MDEDTVVSVMYCSEDNSREVYCSHNHEKFSSGVFVSVNVAPFKSVDVYAHILAEDLREFLNEIQDKDKIKKERGYGVWREPMKWNGMDFSSDSVCSCFICGEHDNTDESTIFFMGTDPTGCIHERCTERFAEKVYETVKTSQYEEEILKHGL